MIWLPSNWINTPFKIVWGYCWDEFGGPTSRYHDNGTYRLFHRFQLGFTMFQNARMVPEVENFIVNELNSLADISDERPDLASLRRDWMKIIGKTDWRAVKSGSVCLKMSYSPMKKFALQSMNSFACWHPLQRASHFIDDLQHSR